MKNTSLAFIIISDQQLKHFQGFGYGSSDLLDYTKLRQAFSQQDLAQFVSLNILTYLGFSKIEVYINSNLYYFSFEDIPQTWDSMSESQKEEYRYVIKPLSQQLTDQYFEEQKIKRNLTPGEIENKQWRFEPLNVSGNDYYLIVVENAFLNCMQIRSKCQSFISECLQHDINSRGLDLTQQSNRYMVYLRLLQLQVQDVVAL